jgi:hypothetical protein
MHVFGNVHVFASKSHGAPRPSCGTAYPPTSIAVQNRPSLPRQLRTAIIKMSFRLLLFVTRRPDLSPEEFKAHWETKHVELIKSIAGDQFPISHTRTYLARPAQAENATWPAAVLVGSQEDFSYDGFAELVFADEAAFKSFFALVSEPENAAKIAADEEKFAVRESIKAVVIGDKTVTSK